MTTRYLIRFDDVVPTMAWSRFRVFDEIADELSLPYLIGVVPECRDPKLMVESARSDFWAWARARRKAGWTIAQHGYQHLYETEGRGLLGIGRKSEFAGLPYEVQFEKLSRGKVILQNEDVWEDVFMAPSHSFDAETLRALRDLNFTAITDGFGFYPYELCGLIAVPQLVARPLGFGIGVETICLHVNTMSDDAIKRIIDFIRTHHKLIISFREAKEVIPAFPPIPSLLRSATSTALRLRRAVRG